MSLAWWKQTLEVEACLDSEEEELQSSLQLPAMSQWQTYSHSWLWTMPFLSHVEMWEQLRWACACTRVCAHMTVCIGGGQTGPLRPPVFINHWFSKCSPMFWKGPPGGALGLIFHGTNTYNVTRHGLCFLPRINHSLMDFNISQIPPHCASCKAVPAPFPSDVGCCLSRK